LRQGKRSAARVRRCVGRKHGYAANVRRTRLQRGGFGIGHEARRARPRKYRRPLCVSLVGPIRKTLVALGTFRFVGLSAFGPKRTCASALQMSAFGGKADMTFAEIRFRGRYWG